MIKIGSVLKKLRKDMNMTMDEVIEQMRLINPDCKISKSSISKWENEIEFPSTESICMIAQIFNVSTDFLLGMNNKIKIINFQNFKREQLIMLRIRLLNDLKETTQNLLLCEEYIDLNKI